MSKTDQSKKIPDNRKYQILAAVLFLLAAGLVLLPKYKKNEGISPELFVKNALLTERYISTDLLADRLVNQDPTILLIDTRPATAFNEFSLPNAVNIPLKDLLNEEFEAYIDQDVYDVILYSNNNFYADEAWMLGNRLGYKNLYVLKGGLNAWFETIIDPKYPDENMPKEAFELYSFRKAAGIYFGVATPTTETKIKEPATKPVQKSPKKVIPVKKKKKRTPEGGC